MNPNVSWPVDVVAFVPNSLLGVEEDVPYPENLVKPDVICGGSFSVDVVAVPKTEPVVVEDEGCTAALGIPVVFEPNRRGFGYVAVGRYAIETREDIYRR